MLYEASTYHCMVVRLSTVIFIFMYIVPFRYIMPQFSLGQSSSSGLLTHFVRKKHEYLHIRARLLAKKEKLGRCTMEGLCSFFW